MKPRKRETRKRVVWKRFPGKIQEYKGRVFISSVRLKKPAAKIKVIGRIHGQIPVPAGVRTNRIVKQELAKEKGLILAEARTRSFVPLRYLGRTEEIERNGAIHQYINLWVSQRSWKKFGRSAQRHALFNYLRELFVKVEKVSGAPPRLVLDKTALENPEAKELMRELNITPEQLFEGMRLYISGRSLLMASEILAHALGRAGRRSAKTITVIVGTAHAAEIQRFLEKPRLAVRYIAEMRKKLPKIREAEGVMAALDEAEGVFSTIAG